MSDQEAILQELNLILATTKQINNNLVNSIELLRLEVHEPATHSKRVLSYSHKEMVAKNVEVLSSILDVLNAM